MNAGMLSNDSILPGPIPKPFAGRRSLPRIRPTRCRGIIFGPSEPRIGAVAWGGVYPSVIPPSPACSLLEFFHRGAIGECLVGLGVGARRHRSRNLFHRFGLGELCGIVLSRDRG